MRKLSTRERVLLVCLAVVALVSGYILLFYLPMSQRMDALNAQVIQGEELQTQLEGRLMHQRKMEKTLNALAEQENVPPRIPEYDNLQAVMMELHGTLAPSQEYSLSFQGDAGEGHLFHRQVTIPFTCATYQQAKKILQELHDSPLRAWLSDVQIVQQENGTLNVTAVMTFFEYQKG